MRQNAIKTLILIWIIGVGNASCAETNHANVIISFTKTALSATQMIVAAKAELIKAGLPDPGTNTCNIYVSLNHKRCVVEFQNSSGRSNKVIFNEHGDIAQVNPQMTEVSDREFRSLSEDQRREVLEFLKQQEAADERNVRERTAPPNK